MSFIDQTPGHRVRCAGIKKVITKSQIQSGSFADLIYVAKDGKITKPLILIIDQYDELLHAINLKYVNFTTLRTMKRFVGGSFILGDTRKDPKFRKVNIINPKKFYSEVLRPVPRFMFGYRTYFIDSIREIQLVNYRGL